MKHKFIALLAACVAWLFLSASPVFAQASPSKCISLITKRLEAVGTADFDFNKARQIIKEFDFGKASEFVNDGGKKLAFQKVFTSMSEFIDLAPNEISGKAMKGYTRLSGGIIRSTGADFVADLKKVFGEANFDGPGFNKVMEQLEGTGTWLGQGKWQSPAGLIFDIAPANRQGHRLTHVFTHTIQMADANHTVFSVPRDELLKLLDDAWSIKPPVNPNDPGGFIIDMGQRIVGTNGEKKILISIDPTNGNILTAYPKP